MKKMAALLSNIERQKPEPIPDEIFIIDQKYIPIVDSGIYYEDPRPDLEEDSNLWCQAFAAADNYGEQLKKSLWDMRKGGTRIIRGKKSFILRPEIDPQGVRGWPDQATYEKWRDRLLKPHQNQIVQILQGLFLWSSQSQEP